MSYIAEKGAEDYEGVQEEERIKRSKAQQARCSSLRFRKRNTCSQRSRINLFSCCCKNLCFIFDFALMLTFVGQRQAFNKKQVRTPVFVCLEGDC